MDILMRMRIVVLDGYCLNPGDLNWDALRAMGDVEVYDRTPEAQVVERAAGATVALTNKSPFSAATLAALDKALTRADEFAERCRNASRFLDPLRERFNARRRRGITQQRLSDLSGVAQSEISRIERGTITPTLPTLQRIIDALGARLAIVFEEAAESEMPTESRPLAV